jgi:hypothetical protein
MPSKSVAFILFGVACVAAAGGGAYIATVQHQRSASSAVTQPAAPVTQPAVSDGTSATSNQPAQPPAEAPSAAASAAASPVSAERAPRATGATADRSLAAAEPAPRARAAASNKAIRLASPEQLVTAPVSRPVAPQPADGARTAPPSQPPLPVASPAEAAAPAPRPWPGAPAPIVPMVIDPAADAVRAEQDAAARAGDKQWEEVVVPAESVIGLQIESSISSEFARVEDRVDARVTRDVRVGSRVAIPAGTRAIGTVVLVERGGKVKERARLGLKFTTLILPDTTRLTVNTETIYREGESPAGKSSAKIGGAAIGGAIIGAILGGGKGAAIGSGIGAAGGTAAAVNGDRMPVTLPAGTPLAVRTSAPISMTVEK